MLLKTPIDGNQVSWNCVKSNMQNTDAWEGSTILFSLKKENGGTKLLFTHSDYKASPCYEVCSEGWNFVLGTSLKAYLESGKGMPYNG